MYDESPSPNETVLEPLPSKALSPLEPLEDFFELDFVGGAKCKLAILRPNSDAKVLVANIIVTSSTANNLIDFFIIVILLCKFMIKN